MLSKLFKDSIIENKYPITLLTMNPVVNENSDTKPKLAIHYLDGIKLISHDFYKHISTH